MNIAWIHWNPKREIFVLPFFDRPVVWYGVFFALGFLVGLSIWKRIMLHFFLKHDPYLYVEELIDKKALREWAYRNQLIPKGNMHPESLLEVINHWISLKEKRRLILDKVLGKKSIISLSKKISKLEEKILWVSVLSVFVGSRIFHVIFYNWHAFMQDPASIFRIWDGGLASHGGGVAMLIGFFFLHRSLKKNYAKVSFLSLLDTVVVPIAWLAFCIRVGNFTNQEIVGLPSNLPWAVVFEAPFDGSLPLPRHPVQLYEAFTYLLLGIILCIVWFKSSDLKPGRLMGVFITGVFVSRFFLEFFKLPQSQLISDHSGLLMGQWLSIPFIILGLILCFISKKSVLK